MSSRMNEDVFVFMYASVALLFVGWGVGLGVTNVYKQHGPADMMESLL